MSVVRTGAGHGSYSAQTQGIREIFGGKSQIAKKIIAKRTVQNLAEYSSSVYIYIFRAYFLAIISVLIENLTCCRASMIT